MRRVAVLVVPGALVAAALAGAPAPAARCGVEGLWTARVVAASGLAPLGCTPSAVVVGTGGQDLYVWAARARGLVPEPGMRRRRVAGVTVAANRVRATWRAGARIVWVEAGPTTPRLVPLVRVAPLVATSVAFAAGTRVIAAHGVRLTVPAGWSRVRAARDAPVVDPRTLLVAGTAGVRPRSSRCQIAAYRVPAAGAVVVVVGWSSVAAAGGAAAKPGRAPLGRLVSVRRPSFECFGGRGAVADVLLRGKPFQVNVLVGDRAPAAVVRAALAVARSFDVTR